jgi:hypothetical protein
VLRHERISSRSLRRREAAWLPNQVGPQLQRSMRNFEQAVLCCWSHQTILKTEPAGPLAYVANPLTSPKIDERQRTTLR